MLKQNAREGFEIEIALRFLEENRTTPAVLARFYFFEIPISAFDQSNREPRSAFSSPIEQVAQIVFRVAQISLDDNSDVRPVPKLRLAEEHFEQDERRLFVNE